MLLFLTMEGGAPPAADVVATDVAAAGVAAEANAATNAAAAQQEQLLQKLAQGDREALAQLYAQTKGAVYGFALSILKSGHAAEDVMQDTYVRVYNAAAGYRAQGKPLAWILTIARNLALAKLREDKKEAPLREWAPPGEESGSFAGQSADRMALHAALTILSDEERQIVILHSLTGMKHREIAAIIGIPLPTTLSKYRRALFKLKKYLQEEA